MLEEHRARVVVTTNAEEASKLLVQSCFRLIVSDLGLPGMH